MPLFLLDHPSIMGPNSFPSYILDAGRSVTLRVRSKFLRSHALRRLRRRHRRVEKGCPFEGSLLSPKSQILLYIPIICGSLVLGDLGFLNERYGSLRFLPLFYRLTDISRHATSVPHPLPSSAQFLTPRTDCMGGELLRWLSVPTTTRRRRRRKGLDFPRDLPPSSFPQKAIWGTLSPIRKRKEKMLRRRRPFLLLLRFLPSFCRPWCGAH